ncbi:MAG: methyltransferase domain-containing protein [Chloroflexi bacterium]|nr:methyltransferase domain-containing protein [Chloroflexota bacterium]
MTAMKMFYELTYRYFRAPWDIGSRRELVEVVESGRIQPCKAIDLGCGTASNAIFLAQHGFEVTGTDFSPAAITLCQKRGFTRRHRPLPKTRRGSERVGQLDRR